MGSPAALSRSAAPRTLRIDSRRRWFPDLREVLGARQLLLLLCKRDLTVMYRQTVLGAGWIFVSSLLSAGLFTFVFGRVAHVSSNGVPYFAFSYAGLLVWNLFAQTLNGASRSMVSNSNLITRIYFPRLVLALSQMASTLLNVVVSFAVMVVLIVIYHIGFSPRMFLVPAWLLLAVLLSIGVGLILTSIAVLYRDVQFVTQAIIPLLLFLTPVAYSTSAVPKSVQTLYQVNPIATIVEGCRWSLVGHTELSLWAVGTAIGLTLAAFVAGLIVFARLEWKFADVV